MKDEENARRLSEEIEDNLLDYGKADICCECRRSFTGRKRTPRKYVLRVYRSTIELSEQEARDVCQCILEAMRDTMDIVAK